MLFQFLVLACLVQTPEQPMPGIRIEEVSAPALSPKALLTEPLHSSLVAVRERFERPWFPSALLDQAPLVAVLIYADQSRFVSIGEQITFLQERDGRLGDVQVVGPAVIWPLLARGSSRFDRLRSVRTGTRVPVDLTSPDLIVIDEGVSVTLPGVGVHSRLMRIDWGAVTAPQTKEALRKILNDPY